MKRGEDNGEKRRGERKSFLEKENLKAASQLRLNVLLLAPAVAAAVVAGIYFFLQLQLDVTCKL